MCRAKALSGTIFRIRSIGLNGLFPADDKNSGHMYWFSADLDKPEANVFGSLDFGESANVTITFKRGNAEEIVRLKIKKQGSHLGANWEASCG